MEHSILFTGHMIDAADRKIPRFPAYKQASVKEEIRKRLLEEKESAKGGYRGIAGGASGGDILFHELCIELQIPSVIYLALPADEFKKASVSFAGKDWEDRFDALMQALPSYVLPPVENEDSVWEKANLWMLDEALANGGAHMSLIALWNGQEGDGPGGAGHMVQVAKEQGAEVAIIDITKI